MGNRDGRDAESRMFRYIERKEQFPDRPRVNQQALREQEIAQEERYTAMFFEEKGLTPTEKIHIQRFKQKIKSHTVPDSGRFHFESVVREISNIDERKRVQEKTFNHLFDYILVDIMLHYPHYFPEVWKASPFEDFKRKVDAIVKYKGKYIALDFTTLRGKENDGESVTPPNFSAMKKVNHTMSRVIIPLNKDARWRNLAMAYVDAIRQGKDPNYEQIMNQVIRMEMQRNIDYQGPETAALAIREDVMKKLDGMGLSV